MNINLNVLRRPVALVSAFAIFLGIAYPAVVPIMANAAQVSGRSISLSNSTPSATGVTYALTMTMPTAAKSMVIDFCTESPIIGSSTCTAPAGMAAGSAAYTSTNPGGTVPGSGGAGSAATGFTIGSGSASQLRISSSTATTAATKYSFYFTGITNPSATGTFYARVYTYADTTYGGTTTAYASAGSIGDYKDYGGFALSTASQVSITAIVQETLTFCVSGSTISGLCGGLTTPALTIGTGAPAVLTSAGQATPAYTQLSTNANGGVSVNMKATNACTNGGLSTAPPETSGGCASISGNGSTPLVMAGGKFGMCVAPGTGVTAATSYTDSVNSCPTTFNATSKYGMNGTNLTSTYGDPIYTTAGAVNSISSSLTFAAMAANTTPAGVYQGNEILIATGTF